MTLEQGDMDTSEFMNDLHEERHPQRIDNHKHGTKQKPGET